MRHLIPVSRYVPTLLFASEAERTQWRSATAASEYVRAMLAKASERYASAARAVREPRTHENARAQAERLPTLEHPKHLPQHAEALETRSNPP